MGRAKEIIVKPITSQVARMFVKKNHYSGKVVANSNLHFGCFLDDKLGGVMQFGSPMDKGKILNLVSDTKWNEMLELNRMAFCDLLPRNSESRCIAIAIKLIKKHYKHIKWILSFSDATQCGDGTIYRASGFYLTGIKQNTTILKLPNGELKARLTLDGEGAKTGKTAGYWKRNGAIPLKGFQLRYIYIIDKNCKLNCEDIPYSKIAELGAEMYKGKNIMRKKKQAFNDQLKTGWCNSNPSAPLEISKISNL
jgi:hypothetical protein